MNSSQGLVVSAAERDLLLRGLRYVRRSIMLEVRDPEPQDELARQNELRVIAELAERLESVAVVESAEV